MKWFLGIISVVQFGFGVLFLIEWLGQTNFRYRMTIDVEVDGKLHSGSSVIEVRYTFGNDGLGLGGLRKWYSRVRGIAPIIDIGRYGTLVAALNYDANDLNRRAPTLMAVRNKPHELRSEILSAEEPPLVAFNLVPQKIRQAKGSAILKPETPVFIWIRPPGDDWRNSRQLLPEQFATLIAPSVLLVKITVERADWATLHVQVPSAPPWLVRLRDHTRIDRSMLAATEPFDFGHHFIETKYDNAYIK